MHSYSDPILFWFPLGFSEPVLVPSLPLIFNLKLLSPEHGQLFSCWNAWGIFMSHPVLSICSFKTDWNIILILSLLPCELLCCLSLLPPHSVIKEPLPQTWIFLLFPDRLLSKPEPHGISPWRSSYLFKVSILKQGGLESSKLISSVYFPVSMNSMITLFLSCPSSVSIQQRLHYGSAWTNWIQA